MQQDTVTSHDHNEPSTPPPSSASIIVSSLKGLTQSTQDLLKHHIELARYEAKADALEVGQDAAGLVIAGVFAALGYVLLLASAVLFASWYAGMAGMAATCFALAMIHLVGGGAIALKMLNNFKTRHYGIVQTKREIEHTKKWLTGPVKEDFSIPKLPAPKEKQLASTRNP